jgi:hypothetical protein
LDLSASAPQRFDLQVPIFQTSLFHNRPIDLYVDRDPPSPSWDDKCNSFLSNLFHSFNMATPSQHLVSVFLIIDELTSSRNLQFLTLLSHVAWRHLRIIKFTRFTLQFCLEAVVGTNMRALSELNARLCGSDRKLKDGGRIKREETKDKTREG